MWLGKRLSLFLENTHPVFRGKGVIVYATDPDSEKICVLTSIYTHIHITQRESMHKEPCKLDKMVTIDKPG